MGEPSIWSAIRDLSTEAMFAVSSAAEMSHTISTYRHELTQIHAQRDRYAAQLIDLSIDQNSPKINQKILGLEHSHNTLDIRIGQLEACHPMLVYHQNQLRRKLEDHLATLCLFKYITVTGMADLAALMKLRDIKNPNALAFTLGESVEECAVIAQLGEDMGIPNLKVGTLSKVENGEFSVVPEERHSRYGFHKKKI